MTLWRAIPDRSPADSHRPGDAVDAVIRDHRVRCLRGDGGAGCAERDADVRERQGGRVT